MTAIARFPASTTIEIGQNISKFYSKPEPRKPVASYHQLHSQAYPEPPQV